jgi:hypothetical protein
MNIRLFVVKALLRVYPADWRSEYGPELADLLLVGRLDVRTVRNVLRNGLWQRIRRPDPSTLFGVVAMLVVATGFVWNIAAPPSSGGGLPVLLQESSKTFPTVIVPPLDVDISELYVVCLVGFGCWTQLHHGGTLRRSGLAAVKIHFIAGIPVMLVGALMLVGVLGVVVSGPGALPSTFAKHGLAYSYYNTQQHELSPFAVLVAPLFRLPGAWIWGVVGGQLARGITHVRHNRTLRSENRS